MAKTKKTPGEASAELLASLVATTEDGIFGTVYGNEDESFIVPKYHYSSGNPPLDALVGEGGFASGKLTEIYGDERTGKSELVQAANSQFLRDFPHGISIYYDQECAIDDKKLEARPEFMSNRCAIYTVASAEKLFKHLENVLKTIHEANNDTPVLISLDSLAALETELEQQGDVGDAQYAPLARIMSSALKRIKPVLQQTNAHLMIVNQTRKKMNSMFESDESTGGKALKFYADYRIRTSPRGNFFFKAEKEKGFPDGILVGMKTIKNKRVPPLREIVIPLIFNRGPWGEAGFNPAWSVYHTLHKNGYIKATGQSNYIVHHKEVGTFTKAEWGAIYTDPAHPLQVPIKKAIDDWGTKLLGKASLEGFPDIPAPDESSEEGSEA